MRVANQYFRTIWVDDENLPDVHIIDQRFLPHQFKVEIISTYKQMAIAIKEMHVRGAGLIGVSGAFGVYLAYRDALMSNQTADFVQKAISEILSSRPTAVNLKWAIDIVCSRVAGDRILFEEKAQIALDTAKQLADSDAESCWLIGENGLPLIEAISRNKKGDVVNILTHCNAGWLAFTDYGSALSPIYLAHRKGIRVHVWVDETRPRNQGAALTAWELLNEGVPHTLISDNTGGHLMQNGMVDLVITGADRIAANGDTANKIGTYLKALAAHDNGIPFYVAAPSSTFDFSLDSGMGKIPIEERAANEVLYVNGLHNGQIADVLICPPHTPAANYGFDITPARLITGIITEKGIASPNCNANEKLLH
ncbi:MAG TPA: S-methyl-5-thioribose-1-phosphate isomerase [Bacteroidales bacterium]|nr:S-methyl-5-thioribose-1-phosphate isomerase [Bacteroidales bacterium]